MYGLPDVFALGLTPEALAEAVPAGIRQRRDVSTTHPTDAPNFARGGYGLYSTVGDFLRFAQMLAGGGQLEGHRVLSEETVALMYRNHLTASQLELFDTFMPGYGFGFGSAVVLDPTRAMGTSGEHGWGGAATTTFWIDSVNDLVGVLMAQAMLAPTTPEHELRTIVQAALAAR
jgi:CubicO group peptidase (beta-lactamase class C family)